MSLIEALFSEDELTRKKANGELYRQLEYAYEICKNELPYEIVPVFIDLLQSEKLSDKTFVTDLLLVLISYSEIETLKEPYKSKALRLRDCVCQGVETYKSLLEHIDPYVREDIVELLDVCDDAKPDDQS